ncbi:DNA modification system-associated small protein [Desulfobulbus elongatus]|uniref:DNA modification system-associated small protein n=1 Tax=Desulfobulbus elongatus TaxID=53332 RepID=UPI000489AB02|nr:DNA modification system-associated small protein [Desulfobulbus elongatus]
MDDFLGDLPLWKDTEARKILEELCAKNNMPVDVLEDLVTLQRDRQHQERAHGVNEAISEILDRME